LTEEELVAVQGFERPVSLKGTQYKRNFLSGSSAKNFTPNTADMSLNPTDPQQLDIKTQILC
jgi:hypothetical protein